MISLQRLPCAKTRIQECGCHCSAVDYTSATANITEMVPIRRHTTTLVHLFHHYRPHSCNCPLPNYFMLRCGLFITTDISPSGKEMALKHPHRSAPCGKALTLVTINSDFFGRHAALVSLPVTPERPITMMVLSICPLLTIVRPTVAHSPPRELVDLEWSQCGREMVMVVSILSSFLMCPFVIEHSELFIRSQELHA